MTKESLSPDFLKEKLSFSIAVVFASSSPNIAASADVSDATAAAVRVAVAVVAVVASSNPLLGSHEEVHVAEDLG